MQELRDRRNEPCCQSAQCEKSNCENQRYSLRPSKRSARHLRHQRIEQICKNCEIVGTSHAANPPNAKNPIAKTSAIAFVRVSVPRDIFVTSGSSRYARIARSSERAMLPIRPMRKIQLRKPAL